MTIVLVGVVLDGAADGFGWVVGFEIFDAPGAGAVITGVTTGVGTDFVRCAIAPSPINNQTKPIVPTNIDRLNIIHPQFLFPFPLSPTCYLSSCHTGTSDLP